MTVSLSMRDMPCEGDSNHVPVCCPGMMNGTLYGSDKDCGDAVGDGGRVRSMLD